MPYSTLGGRIPNANLGKPSPLSNFAFDHVEMGERNTSAPPLPATFFCLPVGSVPLLMFYYIQGDTGGRKPALG